MKPPPLLLSLYPQRLLLRTLTPLWAMRELLMRRRRRILQQVTPSHPLKLHLQRQQGKNLPLPQQQQQQGVEEEEEEEEGPR